MSFFRQPMTASRRRWFMALGLATVVVAIPMIASAASTSIGSQIADKIYEFLANIVLAILQTVAQLTGLFIHVLVFIAQFNEFISVPVVKTGWALVKDVSNMLFIIALLVIAVGTILRLENYRYNRLLGRVVVTAFLVNFSMLIAGFLIQAGQVVMLTFVNAFKDAAFGNFASMFGLDKVLSFAPNGQLPTGLDYGVILMSLIAGLALMVVAMVVTLAICIVLIVRVIALWILIILSPLAYALRILPNTEKFFGQWWGEFAKYVTVGPVLAFFLWLALAIVAGSGNLLSTTKSFTEQANTYAQESGTITAFATQTFTFDVFTTFLVSIIFLVMGLQYATKSGTAGAAWANKVATGGFAFAAAATGLNAIRDRTIAPVQQYFRNRQEAARARVIERAQTLEAGAARMRAALPVAPLPGLGRAGKERAEAAAWQYDQQRAGRVAAERGYKNRTDDELRDRVQRGRIHERLAAADELNQRNKFNLQDPAQAAAFSQLMDVQAMRGRVPPAERRRLRDAIIKRNLPAMNETQIRDRRGAAAEVDEQMLYGEALADRGQLTLDEARDYRRIAGQISPDKEIEFRKKVYGRQGDLAVDAFHRDPTNGAFDSAGLLTAIERGEANEKLILKRRLFATQTEREQVGQQLTEMHKRQGTLDATGAGVDEVTKNDFFRNVNFDAMGPVDLEERIQFANATGHAQRAFRQAGTIMTADLADYTARYRDRLAERAAEAMTEDNEFMAALTADKNFGILGLNKLMDRSNKYLEKVRASMSNLRATTGGETYDQSSGAYNFWKTLRATEARASGSEDARFDVGNADAAVADQAMNELRQYLRFAEGRHLYSADKSTLYTNTATQQQFLEAIGRNFRIEKAPELAAGNFKIANEAYHGVYTNPATTAKERELMERDARLFGLLS